MNEVKHLDFISMVNTSADLAVEDGTFETINDVEIAIQDEDNKEYIIQDVFFDKESGIVVIQFNHDNE